MASHQPQSAQVVDFIIDTGDGGIDEIIRSAYQESPLVKTALNQAYVYNHYLQQEQQALLKLAYTQFDDSPKQNIYQLQTDVLTRIETDLEYIQRLNDVLKTYPPGEAQGEVTWSLKTNKMELALEGAKDLILDDQAFLSMIQGQCPSLLDCQTTHPVILGYEGGMQGSSASTFLSTALIEINLTLLGEDSHIGDLPLQIIDDTSVSHQWLDHSTLGHITAIPKFVALDGLGPDFKQEFSFYFSDDLTDQGLAFVHSGYAFGGQRGENRYESDKVWGPEDCSSWVTKITQSEFDYSTFDQLFAYRLALYGEGKEYIHPDWIGSDKQFALQSLYTPVVIENPLEDIRPGQIFAYRDFDSPQHQNSIGVGGHTGIVIGVTEASKLLVLCYSRDMPDFEGFGIREYNWQSDDAREMMFFDVNLTSIALEDVIDNRSEIRIGNDNHAHVLFAEDHVTIDPILMTAGLELQSLLSECAQIACEF